MLDDALRVVAKRRQLNLNVEDKTLKFLQSMILLETAFPIRIIYSYYGYKTEEGLRNAIINYINESKISPLLFPAYCPNLVICGDISVVKYNGMPFASSYDPHNMSWLFYVSQRGNQVFNFLNILWYRLCYKFSIPFEFLTDGRIYSFHRFISTHIMYIPEYKSDVPVYDYSGYPRNKIEENTHLIPWEPIKVYPSTFEILKYLLECHELVIDNRDIFMKNLIKRLELYKDFISKITPEKLDHFIDEVLDFDSVIKKITETELVSFKDNKLELLTSRGHCVHTDKGMFVGENRDGRLNSWLTSELKK